MSAFFDILTGYFLINLSSSSSKECAMVKYFGVSVKHGVGVGVGVHCSFVSFSVVLP